jgi:hypothetical protein
MSLAANAIITDVTEVWDYLDEVEDQRVKFSAQMDGWINAASDLMEKLCNRNIIARTYTDVTQNGSGNQFLALDHYPIVSISALSIADSSHGTSYVITPADIIIDSDSGKIMLDPLNATINTFLSGFQNITLTYNGGFSGNALEVFKDAVKELISIRWKEIGEHPLNLVRSDNIGSSVSNTKFDPRRLPHIVQQVVWMHRKLEV